MFDGYLNTFLNDGEIVVSDLADDRGIHERVIHQQQKIVQYKTKTLIYSLEEYDIPPEIQNKTPWIKKKTASQLKNWSGSGLSGLAFSHQTNQWVTLGILIQVNEFTDRGINLKNTYYVPGGYLLFDEWDANLDPLKAQTVFQVLHLMNSLLNLKQKKKKG